MFHVDALSLDETCITMSVGNTCMHPSARQLQEYFDTAHHTLVEGILSQPTKETKKYSKKLVKGNQVSKMLIHVSPTEIRTPDGWFKVNSDNHFTIREVENSPCGNRTHDLNIHSLEELALIFDHSPLSTYINVRMRWKRPEMCYTHYMDLQPTFTRSKAEHSS